MTAAGAEESRTAAIADAKRLLRLSRTAALATLGADGSPLTTWVGCASDFDGAPLFLLSTLAQHTKNLAARRARLAAADQPARPRRSAQPPASDGRRADRASSRPLRAQALPAAQSQGQALRAFRRFRDLPHADRGGAFQRRLRPRRQARSRRHSRSLGRRSGAHRRRGRFARRDQRVRRRLAARLAGRRDAGRRVWRAVGLDAEGLDLSAGGAAARVDYPAPAFEPQAWRRLLADALAASPP